MTSKVIEVHKSSSNFSFNPTLPHKGCSVDASLPNCLYFSLFSHSPSRSLFPSLSLTLSLNSLYLPLLLNFYVACFLMIFRSFDQITTLTNHFNLNLRSHWQLFVLVFYFLSNHPKINFVLIFFRIILFKANPGNTNFRIQIFSDSKHSVYMFLMEFIYNYSYIYYLTWSRNLDLRRCWLCLPWLIIYSVNIILTFGVGKIIIIFQIMFFLIFRLIEFWWSNKKANNSWID